MSESPEPELIFPCEYPVKIIGPAEEDFEEFVYELLSRHVPGLEAAALSTRSSGGGKYLSISTTFIAKSRAQVDALYREISTHKRILVAL